MTYFEFKPINVGRLIVWSLFALVLAVVPMLFTSSLSHTMLSQMGIAIIVCLSYNMLLGHGGMLSFGHAVYSGLGSFLAIHTLNMVTKGTLPLPVSLVPIAGGLFGALFAVILGWVTTKKAATPFAMITMGVGELVWAMSLMFPEFFGGEGGINGNRVTQQTLWHNLWATSSALLFNCDLYVHLYGTHVRIYKNATRQDAQCCAR